MLKLTATQLPRFVECNGFLHLDKIPAFNNDTQLRDEGDAAHWFVEQVFKGEFIAEELIDRKAPNGIYIDADMAEHCEEYIEAIKGKGSVETDTSYAGQSWQVAGRVDHIHAENGVLNINDFKYGWKIVEPEENWTLLSHGFGFLSKNPEVAATVHTIRIRIFQPRPYHPKGSVREWVISAQDLWNIYWAKLSPMLENPSNQIKTGPHCYKCESMAVCPAAQIAAMNAIEVTEQAYNSELEPAQISQMLDLMKRASEVIKQTQKAYEDAALHQAKQGKQIPNYSIQKDLSNEQWKEGITSATIKAITGVDISKDAMITPGQAKKKGISEHVLKPFYERKEKGAKLVRVSDSERAKQMFGSKT